MQARAALAFRFMIAAPLLATMLAACGTTSSLKPAENQLTAIDLTHYQELLVVDFADEASSKAKPEIQALVRSKVESAQKTFPELIATSVRSAGGFTDVTHGAALARPDPAMLVMRGAITEWDDGNAALKMLVGFGAGGANFNARVELIDGGTGELLGSWIVDKNSWALGGVYAATQTAESFMPGAAKSIGEELSKRKKAGFIIPPASK